MAKRKVNKKFLVILTAAVVGLGGGAVTWKFLKRENPAKYVAMAQTELAAGNYERAAKHYGAAFGYGGKKDLDLMMKQAEAWRKLAETDPVYMTHMIQCWRAVLEINGQYVPALRKMMEHSEDYAKARPAEERGANYARMREYAERLAKADPSDKVAQSKVPMAVILPWFGGVATDPKSLEDAVAQLEKMRPADPSNVEIPTVLTQVHLRRAEEALRRSDAPAMEREIQAVVKTVDEALQGQDDNIEMHALAVRIFNVLGQSAERSQKKEQAKKYKDRFAEEVAKVVALGDAANDKHSDDLLAVGLYLNDSGDVAGGEALLKKLMDARPDDQSVRLGYAKVVAKTPGGRAKAMEVLSTPVTRKEWSSATQKAYERQRLYDLSLMQLEQFIEYREPAEKEAALKAVEANVAKLFEMIGETPALLRLRGKLQLYRGQDTDAIQTLVKAQQLLQGRDDDELAYTLAGAYLQTRQTGEAKKLLVDLIARHPGLVPARRMMVQMFLAENDPENAEPHLQALEKAVPQDADVKRMRMASYMLRKQPEQAKKLFDELPEGDTRAKFAKAQVALGIGNNDDAVRLLELVRKAEPKSTTVVRMLVAAHRGRNDMASALQVIDEAIAASPQDLTLVGLRKALAGASGDEMVKFTREMVEQNPDPYVRELQRAAIAADEGKTAESIAHLKEAEKLKPEDRQVLEALFNAYMKDAKWDLAAVYGDKLGKANLDKAGGALFKFRLLMAQGKFPEALAAAQELSRKMPEFAQTWVTLALAQQATNQLDAAVQSYQRALEKQSDNADAMRGLIDCHYLQNKPADAQRYIALARRTFPTNAYFRDLEMRHMLQHGDPEQAVAQYEELRKQNMENRGAWANLAQAYWRSLVARQGKGDAAGVKKHADALAALAEDGIKKWPDERLFYAFLADLSAARGDMAGGIDALKRLGAQPAWKGKPEVPVLIADYYARFGKLPEAEASAREAMATVAAAGGDDAAVRMKLASIQAAAGNIDEAIKTLDPKVENPAVARQKLQILAGARRLESAEKLATSMLQKEPRAADVLNALVTIYLEGGQFDQALARVNEVLALDPNNVAALYGRGLVYLRRPKPDVDAGIADLKAVREKDERHFDARYWLGEAYVAKGDYESAIRELDAAVRVQPNNKAMRLRLVKVCSSATPPRWVDAERIIREGRALPGMANDVELVVEETRMWIARRQADRAVTVAREAAAATKGHPEVIRVYFDALLASGNYQRLLDETEKMVVEGGATPWWVFQNRAVAKRRLDKKDEAMTEFERALSSKEAKESDGIAALIINKLADEVGVDEAISRVKPKAVNSHQWQMIEAFLYQQKRDYAGAIASVERTLGNLDKLSRDDKVATLRFAGTMYLSAPTPMPEKAMEMFKLSLKEYPEDTAVLNNMASLLADYLDKPQPEEALKYSQQAYDIMRKAGRVEPLVLDTHGRVLTLVNRVPEGIVLLQDAADRMSIPDVHYHLAEAYMQQKAPEEAQKHLVKATAAIEVAKKAQTPIDPKMVKRVEELTAQAKQMIAAKAQAGAR